MTEHAHARSTDNGGKIVIPSWIKQLVLAIVFVVTSTVAVLGYMDKRYASKEDIVTVTAKLDDMSGDLKDIKRELFRGHR